MSICNVEHIHSPQQHSTLFGNECWQETNNGLLMIRYFLFYVCGADDVLIYYTLCRILLRTNLKPIYTSKLVFSFALYIACTRHILFTNIVHLHAITSILQSLDNSQRIKIKKILHLAIKKLYLWGEINFYGNIPLISIIT